MTPSTEWQAGPSRRTLLAGAAAGVAAFVVSGVARLQRVRGANGEVVHVGDSLAGTATTILTNTDSGESAIWGNSSAISGVGVGIRGDTASAAGYGVWGNTAGGVGVRGDSTSGSGVRGVSTSGTGVRAQSTDGDAIVAITGSGIGVNVESTSGSAVDAYSGTSYGVLAATNADNRPAIWGRALGLHTGVLGTVGDPIAPFRVKTGVHGFAAAADTKAVWGESVAGHGIHGSSVTGFAGYFSGKVFTNAFYELTEINNPAAPGTNRARLFVRDNGSGKTQLCVRFQSGSIRVLTTEA